MPTVNSTHRKRLARLLADQTDLTYMQALDQVSQAAVAGRLPARLDETGMQAALRILTDPTAVAEANTPSDLTDLGTESNEVQSERRIASDPKDQAIYDLSHEYEAITGKQGLVYITSPTGKSDRYVFGGGFTALGRREALDHIQTLVADAKLNLAPGSDRYYLIDDALRLLRQVWQGRVTLERHLGRAGAKTRYTIDNRPASDIKSIHLAWLRNHNYFEVNLSPGEEWAIARTTTFGDEVLARNGADRDKFADGLPANHKQMPTAEPYDYAAGFDLTGTRQATARDLLKVSEKFREAGRIDWWWHDGPQAGRHGTKTVEPDLNKDEELVLIEDSGLPSALPLGEVTTLDLDTYLDTPDKAERHLVWPGHSGITFRNPDGSISSTYRLHVDTAEEASRKEAVASSTPLDPATDRLMGGPYTTKVAVRDGKRTEMPRCDVCNRRLKAGEKWWMVHAPSRGWENSAGVVCVDHKPARLRPYSPSGA